MRAARDETRDVGHVDHHDAADLVADFAHAPEVDRTRIGARARQQDLRLHLQRKPLDLVVIEPLRLPVHRVRHDVVDLARKVDGRAVAQVAALVERHRQDRIARLERREIDGHVRRAAAVRLDVRVLRAEERAGARAGQLLRRVDRHAAGIPALARIALGILVHEDGPCRLAARAARRVLRRDEIDFGVFLLGLRDDGREHLGIGLSEPAHVAQPPGALEFGATARVAFARILGRRDEGGGDLGRVRRAHRLRAEAEHVRAVVLARDDRLVHRPAKRRADVLEAVGRHRHADAARADENAEIHLALRDGERHRLGVVGIVARFARIRPLVDQFRLARERGEQRAFEFITAVIGTDCNLHLASC